METQYPHSVMKICLPHSTLGHINYGVWATSHAAESYTEGPSTMKCALLHETCMRRCMVSPNLREVLSHLSLLWLLDINPTLYEFKWNRRIIEFSKSLDHGLDELGMHTSSKHFQMNWVIHCVERCFLLNHIMVGLTAGSHGKRGQLRELDQRFRLLGLVGGPKNKLFMEKICSISQKLAQNY